MDYRELSAPHDQIEEKLEPLFLERMGVSIKVEEYKAENHRRVF